MVCQYTTRQPKMADETLLSPRKKHLIIMQLSRADHRGRALASNVAETTAALRIQFSKTWRRGEGREGVGKPLSHPQLRTLQLVGALNFLCMNYDVRNSWLVSHQNEAPISARGPEIQMPLSRYPLSKVAHLDVTSRLAGQRC